MPISASTPVSTSTSTPTSISTPISMCVCMLCHFDCVLLFATLRTVASQTPLSTGFSRQEHWSGLPCPPPGDLAGPGINQHLLMSPALAGGFFTTRATWEVHIYLCTYMDLHLHAHLCLYLPIYHKLYLKHKAREAG